MKFRFQALCVVALLLSGCHTFSGTHMDEVVSQRPSAATLDKVLLVGITTTAQAQVEMEQAFAREFGKRQRDVRLASTLFPGDRQPLREAVVQQVKADGVTGVLVVRLLSYEPGRAESADSGFSLRTPARDPGTRVGWEQDAWLTAAPPADGQAQLPKAVIETRLYDVVTGAVVWQGRSRTLTRSDRRKELEGFVNTVMMELHKSGWL